MKGGRGKRTELVEIVGEKEWRSDTLGQEPEQGGTHFLAALTAAHTVVED